MTTAFIEIINLCQKKTLNVKLIFTMNTKIPYFSYLYSYFIFHHANSTCNLKGTFHWSVKFCQTLRIMKPTNPQKSIVYQRKQWIPICKLSWIKQLSPNATKKASKWLFIEVSNDSKLFINIALIWFFLKRGNVHAFYWPLPKKPASIFFCDWLKIGILKHQNVIELISDTSGGS